MAALALAFSSDIPRCQKLTNDLARNFPQDTIVEFNYLPTIHAQLALDAGDSRKATAAADAVAAYELGDPVEAIVKTAMYPIFVRGQAYLDARDGYKSATEFQKVLDLLALHSIGPSVHSRISLLRALTDSKATQRGRG